ncbi:uncharacterized protein LOC135398247 [Ornithodoros turicata]|uniref:uncharacterized protein LOC135398247 n=1 Tax=Ornithodoros turicata TaxID=34597 RepID=UPI003139FB28
MRYSVVYLLLLAYGAGILVSTVTSGPGCSDKDIRSCGMDFIPFYNATRLAEDAAGLEAQCKLYITQVSCAENFTRRCLQGFPRAVALLGLQAALADYEEGCNATSAKYKVYIENIPCINKAGPRLHQCINSAFDIFQTATEKAPEKRKIGYACCYYYELQDCFRDALRDKCNRPQVLNFFTEIMDHVFGDMLQLGCGRYRRGSSGCKTIPPLPRNRDLSLGAVNIVETIKDVVNSLG